MGVSINDDIPKIKIRDIVYMWLRPEQNSYPNSRKILLPLTVSGIIDNARGSIVYIGTYMNFFGIQQIEFTEDDIGKNIFLSEESAKVKQGV